MFLNLFYIDIHISKDSSPPYQQYLRVNSIADMADYKSIIHYISIDIRIICFCYVSGVLQT